MIIKILIILGIFVLTESCSKEETLVPEEIEENLICCSQVKVNLDSKLIKLDSTLTRSFEEINDIYLVVGYNTKSPKYITIPVQRYKETYYINICFYIIGKNILLKTINEEVIVSGKKCILSTVKDNRAILNKSNNKTPGGKDVYKPFGDNLLISKEFYFTKKYNKIYLNSESRKIDVTENPSLTLIRFTARIKVNIIVTDMWSGLIIHTLDIDDFEAKLGSITDWSIKEYIINAPMSYNISNKSYSGKCIVELSDINRLQDKIKHDAIQLQFGQPVIIGRFIGPGYLDTIGNFIFPISERNECNIGFTFYYTGPNEDFLPSTTLSIPVEGIDIYENSDWEIFIVIDYNDLEKAITGEYDTRGLNNINYKIYSYDRGR